MLSRDTCVGIRPEARPLAGTVAISLVRGSTKRSRYILTYLKRPLPLAVAVARLVPVAEGLAGMLLGPGMIHSIAGASIPLLVTPVLAVWPYRVAKEMS